MHNPPTRPTRHGSRPPCLLLLAMLVLAAACDRREQGVEGDLSPETGATTPTPQETPPSDPASGSATTPPDDATDDTMDDTADDRGRTDADR